MLSELWGTASQIFLNLELNIYVFLWNMFSWLMSCLSPHHSWYALFLEQVVLGVLWQNAFCSKYLVRSFGVCFSSVSGITLTQCFTVTETPGCSFDGLKQIEKIREEILPVLEQNSGPFANITEELGLSEIKLVRRKVPAILVIFVSTVNLWILR